MTILSTRRVLRSKAGQTMLILAFAVIVIIALVGLAIDTAVGYFNAVSTSRAAEAAALSGVVFMPNQFLCDSSTPLLTGHDAKDRAWAEARRNGVYAGNTALSGAQSGIDNCAVTPNPPDKATDQVTVYSYKDTLPPGETALAANQIEVRVTRQVPVYFLGAFGFRPYNVVREAVADYLPPISLGQPGAQQGSAVSQLGTQPFILRTEGWSTDRGQGDAFTPNPNKQGGVTVNSQDVHAISGVNNSEITTDPALWDRGGYNYRVIVPTGKTAHIQVYNAAFSPDGNGKPHDFCDNYSAVTGSPIRACNTLRGNYYLHEDDGGPFSFGTNENYATMQYTVFGVNNEFIRREDTELTKMKVGPINAENWAAGIYHDIVNNCDITQVAALGSINMQVFHQWVDVTDPTFDGTGIAGGPDSCNPASPNLVTMDNNTTVASLSPGTYRLRIDTLDWKGNIPGGGDKTGAHKATAVRVVDDATGALCDACRLAAWEDISVYTPVDGTGTATFSCGVGCFEIPMFQLPQFYAGKTITFDMFDLGDISGGGKVDLGIVPPSPAGTLGPIYSTTAGGGGTAPEVCIYNLGVDRLSNQAKIPACGVLPSGGYCSDLTSVPVSQSLNPSNIPCEVHNLTAAGTPAAGRNNRAQYRGTVSGCPTGCLNDNYWYRMEIPISSNYNPKLCSDPAYTGTPTCTDGYWHLRYATNDTAGDTWTFAVGLKGSPLRILRSS